jgi:hypothetical protein
MCPIGLGPRPRVDRFDVENKRKRSMNEFERERGVIGGLES